METTGKKNEKHILALVCKGAWDNGSDLSIEGEQQMKNIVFYLHNQILQYHTDITTFDILLPKDGKLESKCAEIFIDALSGTGLSIQSSETKDFLKLGFEGNSRKIAKDLLEYASSKNIVIVISSKNILQQLPKEMLNVLTSSHKDKLMKFADNRTNFIEKRGIIIVFDDEKVIHRIHQA